MVADLPLNGYKVLELASVLAGPSVGMFLAELGADVIKVENLVTGGDVTRRWKLSSESPETDISGYFSCVNWGKRSLAVDITKPDGLEIIYRLVKKTDIVLVNYKPGDAEKLKVDFETFRKINNKIIYAHLTGYGLKSKRAGFDAIVQAETGFTYMNGEAERSPTKMPVALMDILAAHHMKEAILLALLNLHKTGEGSFIDASLYSAGITSLANQATNWLVGNSIPERMDSDHPNIVPYGTLFHTFDEKEIVLAVGTEKQFSELCELLGRPELAKDEMYSTNIMRVRNKESIKKLLQDLISQFTRESILQLLAEKSIPAGGVLNMREVFETKDAREMLLKHSSATGTIEGVTSVGFTINRTPFRKQISPPPRYGGNTYEILRSLEGFTDDIVNILTEQKVIYGS